MIKNKILYEQTKLKAINNIREYVCQFLVVKKGKIKGDGSGVFIKVDNYYFLITAAHVTDDREYDLKVPVANGKAIIIQGELNTNTINGLRKDDKVDICIYKLNEHTLSLLDNYYNFLEKEDLGINHNLNYLDMYLTFGYPSSQTEQKYKTNIVIARPFYFVTQPKTEEFYSLLQCKQSENIIIHFDKYDFYDKETGKQYIAPNTYGMSGSGLWYVPEQTNNINAFVEKKLVAILTEWWNEDKKCIISTRIDVVSEIIRQTYNLNLPVSSIFNARINFTNKQ